MCVWHGTCTCVTWIMHSRVWHDSHPLMLADIAVATFYTFTLHSLLLADLASARLRMLLCNIMSLAHPWHDCTTYHATPIRLLETKKESFPSSYYLRCCTSLLQSDLTPQTQAASRGCIPVTNTHHSKRDIERGGNRRAGWAAALHAASFWYKDTAANTWQQ